LFRVPLSWDGYELFWNVHRTILEQLRAMEWRLGGIPVDGVAPLTSQANIGQQRDRWNGATPEQRLLTDDDRG